MKRYLILLTAVIFMATGSGVRADSSFSLGLVSSFDDVPISYATYATGGPAALVFVHGWSCDSRYWRRQTPFFSKQYRVITLDLAGHGLSGLNRRHYAMASFARDVKAVVDTLKEKRVILVGHSMGGAVIAEAARLMPERVIGLIGVDTLQNIAAPMTSEALKQMIASFKADFKGRMQTFVSEMFVPGSSPSLKTWIVNDMSAAPERVAIDALNAYLEQYVNAAAANVFKGIAVPVVCVNADLWPTDVESNRRYIQRFEVLVLKGAGHFLMLAQADRFNPLLERAIQMVLSADR